MPTGFFLIEFILYVIESFFDRCLAVFVLVYRHGRPLFEPLDSSSIFGAVFPHRCESHRTQHEPSDHGQNHCPTFYNDRRAVPVRHVVPQLIWHHSDPHSLHFSKSGNSHFGSTVIRRPQPGQPMFRASFPIGSCLHVATQFNLYGVATKDVGGAGRAGKAAEASLELALLRVPSPAIVSTA